MKTSVLIVAHNEEKYIKRCIESVLAQTKKPDEIVVIAHNCTDKTIEIAKKFKEVKVVDYQGPRGVVFARIKGVEVVNGEIIACIDADSFAHKKWLERLLSSFGKKDVVAVGGYVSLIGANPEKSVSVYGAFFSIWFFFLSPWFQSDYHFYFWGANFAFRKSTYEKIGGLDPLVELNKKWKLNYWTDDLYLSLAFEKEGKVVFSPWAKVWSHIAEEDQPNRGKEMDDDRKKLFDHFKI